MTVIKLLALACLVSVFSSVKPHEQDTKQQSIECIKTQMLHKGLATHADLRELDDCVFRLDAFFTAQKSLSEEEAWEHLLQSPHTLKTCSSLCGNILKNLQKRLEQQEKHIEEAIQHNLDIHIHATSDEQLVQVLRQRYPQLIIMTRDNHHHHHCLHHHTGTH